MTSSERKHGEKPNCARSSSSGKTERKREGGGRSSVSRGRSLLIEDPRTSRGPRSPDSTQISSEKETPIGSLLPVLFSFFLYISGLLHSLLLKIISSSKLGYVVRDTYFKVYILHVILKLTIMSYILFISHDLVITKII